MTFDARRAEPGQEFGYTGTDRKLLDEDEDVPEGARLEVETEPGHPDDLGADPTVKRFAVRDGVQKTLRADKDGRVHPKTVEDEAVLTSFGLAVVKHEKKEDAKTSEAPDEKKE